MEFKNMKKQCGTTMFLSLVFMLGMVAMIGLATTTGRLVTDKTTLQNALDAAALSAAITVNGDPAKKTATATQKGRDTFNTFKAATGNHELSGVQDTDLTFEYSKTLKPFDPKSTPPAFVRVSMNKPLAIPAILLQVLDTFKDPIDIAAVSTAGPEPQNCQLAPIVMCAAMEPSPSLLPKDPDCSDGFCYGYQIGKIYNLLPIEKCNGPNCPDPDRLEAGNFNLVDVGSGANDVKEALRGTNNLCTSGTQTEPGYSWGPVKQGIDEKFNSSSPYGDTQVVEYKNSSYPLPPGLSPYTRYYNQTDGVGNNRRILPVAIADCRGKQNGKSPLTILGTFCMFLTQQAIQQGSTKGIMAEIVRSCAQSGPSNPTNSVLNGTYNIVLYKTQGSGDS
jgi:hypothetical protein